MKTRHYKHVMAALASAAVLTACSGGESAQTVDDSATLEEVYEAAKSEGELVIYGPGETLMQPVYDLFMQEYPEITVTTVTVFGAELDSRLQAEQASGGGQADLVHNGVPDSLRYEQQGILDELTPIDAGEFPDDVVVGDHGWVIPQKTAFGLIYNTNATTAADVPETWGDLVNPDLKGELTTSDFTVSAACAAILTAAYEEGVIDDGWLKSLKDDVDPLIFPGTIEATNAVVTGEATFQLCANYSVYQGAKAQGAPLGFAYSTDGVYLEGFPYSQLTGAEHPNAAKLFATWILSDEAQAAIAQIGAVPTMPDAPKPAGLEDIGDYPEMAFPGLEAYGDSIELFSETF